MKVDIEGNKDTKTYNGEDQSITGYTVTPEGSLLTADLITGPAQEAAIATGKDASETPYKMGLTADQFSCSSGNFKDIQYNITDGELTINPKTGVTVTITGNTNTETYDGTEKTVEGYTFSSDYPLYVETMVGFSGTKTASGTVPGEYKMGLAKTQFSNDDPNFDEVEFIVEDGKLTIDPLSFTLDAGGGVEKFYDSDPTNLLVKIVEDLPPAVKPEFYYSYSPTGPFIPAKDFTGPTNVLESSDVTCRVIIPGTTNDITAKVTIKARPVTLVAGSDKKVFDNTPLTCDMFTVKEDETTPGYGFVKNEGVDSVGMTAASTQTLVGSTPNVIDPTKIVFKTASDKTLASNYDVTCENGKLTVTEAVLTPDITSFKGPYDADPHQVTVNPTSVPGATIEYALSPEGPWQTGVIPFTDATNVIVYVKVTKENFVPFTAPVELTITKRPITLEGPDKETTADKVSAAKPLTFTKDEIKVGGSLFAKDETFTYADFASIYTVGKTKSVFTWTDGTAKVANYEVTLLDDHYLTVKPSAKQIEVRSLDGKWTYDGAAHGAGMVTNNVDQLTAGDELAVNFHGVTITATGTKDNTFDVAIKRDGEDVTASYADRLVAITGVLEVVNAKFTDPDINAPAVEKIYDADPTNLVVTIVKDPMPTNPKILYSTNGVDFAEELPTFTDVTNAVVWYIVQGDNYDPYTNKSTVVVTPRAVTLTSPDKAQKFNASSPLTFNGSEITKTGFAKDEADGVSFTDLASITAVGSTNAAFTVVFDETKAKARNYTVTKELGTLQVFEGDKITFAAESHVFDYTGSAQTWKEYIKNPDPASGLDTGDKIDSVTFKTLSSITKPSEGEVANEIASVKIVNGSGTDVTANYAGRLVFLPGTLTMRKGNLAPAVTAQDAVKMYDAKGTNVTVTVDTTKTVPAGATNVKIYWSMNGGASYSETAPSIADAVEQEVFFRVEADEYEPYVGSALVKVSRRPVKLVSAGATKAYDKSPLTTNDVWVAEQVEGVNYELATGDKLDTYSCSGSQTVVGKAWNQFTFKVVNTSSTDVGKNYDFSFDYGILEVTPANQKWNPPGGGDPDGTPFDYVGMYDGDAHTITPFTVTEPDPNEVTVTITYSTNQIDWTASADDYARTDVCKKVPVYFKSVAENYADVVTNGYITITQRVVTVKSADATFVYDQDTHDKPLTTVVGTQFVAGEGISTNNFATIVTVAESGKKNTFDYTFNEGTKESNYKIVRDYGTLTMVPATPEIPEEEGPGGPKHELPPGGLEPPKPAAGAPVSTNDWVGVYDGKPHTILTNQIFGAIAADPLYTGNSPQVEYSLTGADGTWQPDPFEFTEVTQTPTSFWYRITADNCSNYYHVAGVTITNRPVTITFTAADKIYDKSDVATCTATNFENVVAGEAFTLDTSTMTFTFSDAKVGVDKTVTAAGYSDALVAAANAETDKSNYSFTFVPTTTATIRGAELKYRLEGFKGQYDGKTHGVSVIVDPECQDGTTVYYSLTGEDGSWTTTPYTYTDVTNVTVLVKLVNSNYDPTFGSKPVTIEPRKIILAGPDKAKDYDGLDLTFTKDEITVGGSKYAEGEEFAYEDIAVIQNVGKKASLFTCRDNGKAKLSNYAITIEENHYLVVNPAKDAVGVRSLDYYGKYDGVAHGAGYELIHTENLIAGDTFEVELDGVTVTTPDDGIRPNTFKSIRILRGTKDVTASYAGLSVITGSLQVVNADFGEDDIVVKSVKRVYDATPTNITVTVVNPLATEVKVTYSEDGVSFRDDVYAYTDVCEKTTWATVTAKYFNPAVVQGTVEITKRYLEFASAENAGKVYDMTPLVTDTTKIKETSASKGFATGEKAGCSFTATASVTDVTGDSPVPATFDVVLDGTIAKSNNYEIVTVPGLLHIYPQGALVVQAESKEFAFSKDGTEKTWHKATVTGLKDGDTVAETDITFSSASKITRPKEGPVANVATGVKVMRGTEDVTGDYSPTYEPGALTMELGSLDEFVSAKDVEKIYDAKGTNIVVVVDTAKLIDPSAEVVIEYRTSDEEPWSPLNPVFTNKVFETVQYRVSVEEYKPFVGSATVKIDLRKVKLVSGTDSKTWDGSALTKNEVTVEPGDGYHSLAEGEFLNFTCTGTQTDVGASQNTFDYWVTNAVEALDLRQNYDFTVELGTLTVEAKTFTFEVEDFRGPYDGEEHRVYIPGPAEQTLPAGATRSYSLDGQTWQDDPFVFKDVTNVTVYARVTAPNHAPQTVPVNLEIWRRQLTLEAPNKVESFAAGKTLTFTDGEIKAGGQLYATGECFKYTNHASIDAVGKTGSTFDYADSDDGKTKLSNYEVTIVPNRWLELLPGPETITVRSLSYYGKYDGKAHGADYEIIDNGRLFKGDAVVAVLDGKTVKDVADGIVDNTFASVKILRNGAEDVTSQYSLTKVVGTLEVVNADFTDDDIVAEDVTRKYDGTGTNITVEVKNTLAKGQEKVRYSLDGVTFQGENPSFTNVTETTVWYEVTAPNFNAYTNSAVVTITPRKVGFRSLDDYKVYDGTALEATNVVEITEAGYDGFVTGEGATTASAASIIQVGSCEAAFNVTFNDGTRKENYTLVKEAGTLRILSKTDLTIIAGSQEFTYDGSAHKCETCTTINLKAGHRVVATYTGSITTPDQSPVKNQIVRASVKIVDDDNQDFTANYGDFTLVDGTLTMPKLSLEPYVSAEDVEKTYDAEKAQITVNVDKTALVAAAQSTVKITYATAAEGPFGATNPQFTKAGTYDVWYVVSATGYLDTTPRKAQVKINLRPLKLVSAGLEQFYSGKEVSTNDVKVAVEGDFLALADGEYLDAACNAKITNAGEVENTFTFVVTNAPNEASLKDNYFVTFEHGLLKVKKVSVKVQADPVTLAWGEPAPSNYTYTVRGLVNNELPEDVLTGAPQLIGQYVQYETEVGDYTGYTRCGIGTLAAKDGNYTFVCEPGDIHVVAAEIPHTVDVPKKPYDGLGTNITVTITQTPPPETGVVFKKKFITPEGTLVEDFPPVYTNAGSYKITYIIEDGTRYAPVTNEVTMLITPRKITLKSPNKDKVYDGEPLALLADDIGAGGMGFADGERFTFEELAWLTDVGTTKATFTYTDGTALLANYEIVSVEYGELLVKPNAEQILVCSASGTWTYDGKPHGTNGYEIVGWTDQNKLDPADEIQVELAGSMQTEPGISPNRFNVTIWRGGEDVTQEYLDAKMLKQEDGTLTVVKAKFKEPTVTPYRGYYDGNSHGIKVQPAEKAGVTVNVTYPETGNDFTDVTNLVVKFTMQAEHYDDYEGEATVEILPLKLRFSSANGMQKYNGSALETDTSKIVASGTLPAGETPSYSNPGSQTEVGRGDATFDVTITGTKAKASNYEIEKVSGALTVFDAEGITVIATNAVHVFDGEAYTNYAFEVQDPKGKLPTGAKVVPAFDPASTITYPGTVENTILAARIYDENGVDITATLEDAVLIPGQLRVVPATFDPIVAHGTNVVYDGTGYSITVEEPVVKGSGPVKIEYSTVGLSGPFGGEKPSFVPAGTYTVYFKVSAPGYEDAFGSQTVTITRRPVTIESGSDEKFYDATSLSNGVVNVSTETPLATGDKLVAVTTASQTIAGSTENTFDYQIADEGLAEERTKNYDVTLVYGTLTVKPYELDVTYSAENKLYDGNTNATWVADSYAFSRGSGMGAIPAGQGFALNADGVKFYFDAPEVKKGRTVTAYKFGLKNVKGTNDVSKTSNYVFNFKQTTLADINLAPPPPLDPDDPGEFPPEAGPFDQGPDVEPPAPVDDSGNVRKLSNYDVVTIYDGRAHTFDVTALSNKIADCTWFPGQYGLTYSLDGKNWSEEGLPPFAFTNVVSTSFWYKVQAPFVGQNYSNYIHAVGVTITNRHVTITTEGTNFVYNTKAQSLKKMSTEKATAAEIDGGKQTGFVPGEDIDTTDNWTEVTNVVDVADNEFTFTLKLNESYGSVKENYAFDWVKGVLKVDPAKPVIPEEGPGKNGPFYGPGDPPLPPQPAVGDLVSTNDYIGIYDGDPHTIYTNQIWGAIAAEPLYAGNDPSVAYSLTGQAGTWQEAPFEFTDCCCTSFWYRIRATNNEDYYHAASVTITQRIVRIVFPKAEKVYDDTPDAGPLETNIVGVADGLVYSERFDALGYGGFLDDHSVGEDRKYVLTNVTMTASAGAKFGNYIILFGANGGIAFEAGADPGEGPASFGPKGKDPTFPDDDEQELRLPGQIFECAPHFKVEMKWYFCANSGTYYARMKITCLNTTDTFDYTPGRMRFIFQDRMEGGVLKLGLWDSWKNMALSKIPQVETLDGQTYSFFTLADPDPSDDNGGWAPQVSKDYGPASSSKTDMTAENRKSTPEMRVYKRVNPVYGNEEIVLAGENPSCFVGWLVWNWTDTKGVPQTSMIPVASGLPEGMDKWMDEDDPLDKPLSIEEMNRRIAINLPFDREEQVNLTITRFSLGALKLTGLVRTENTETGATAEPGVNARVVLKSAAAVDGTFEETDSTKVGADGSFEFDRPAEGRFFKLELEALPLVK